jgi:CMP-N,N'-diacetyllegionaminic acid synthase
VRWSIVHCGQIHLIRAFLWGGRKFLKDEVLNKRSQDLEKYYRLNGAIYICKTNLLLEEKTLFLNDNIFAYIMDTKNSIDIDKEIDFKMTEFFINNY